MHKIIIFCLLTGLLSCQHPTPFAPVSNYACGIPVTRSSQALSATIFYSKAMDIYYTKSIYLNSPTSTIDSTNQEINIFCALPDDYKVAGKVIKFDGSYAPIKDTTGFEGTIKKSFHVPYLYYLQISKIY
ncbi:MAG: hypothetical protein DSM106950_45055 [Stigonema ocellatum SAG 48.90 = DSM 106950]|nr:hypothetical protein [Stigonema ocellatum SAG 48.90 = DSM 106950]